MFGGRDGKDRSVKGFGCQPSRRLRQVPGPVSESLQGTNPREMGRQGAILAPRCLRSAAMVSMVWAEALNRMS